MSKLVWDAEGTKTYETGVDHGVLYVMGSGGYDKGVAWNGLTGVTESPSGAEATPLWADNVKYLSMESAEEFGATIEAYTYPVEFDACNGAASLGTGVTIGQQGRKTFAFSYRTINGNDTEGDAYGYKLHIIYGAKAAPSEKAYATKSDSPEAITFSWEITTTPVNVDGFKPTSYVCIDSKLVGSATMKKIEDKLYGSDSAGEPTLLMPDEIKTLITPAM